MKPTSEVFILILVICFAIFFGVYINNSHEKDAISWITNNGENVVDIKRCFFDTGPYWPTKNVQFFRIETDKRNVYWVRYGWGRTIKKELVDGDYEIIED